LADDTSFSYSNRDELQIKTVIDQDLKELDEWSKKWLMSFNPDKTEIMLFSNTDIPDFNFTFNGRTKYKFSRFYRESLYFNFR
jgi:hypothetical protein